MRVFGLTTGADTAGINFAIHDAFRRYAPDWDVRAMVATINYIAYPHDMVNNGSVPARRKLEEVYDASDVIHLHNTLHAHRWYDAGQGKPTVLMHHGLSSGSGPTFAEMVREAAGIGASQVCSTLDLALREPSVTWLPAPANLAALRAIRARYYHPSQTIRVGHAPTVRSIKGSDAFDVAMQRLRRRLPIESVVIQRASWKECLRRKATVDVFFDQPELGYGSNAIEAWAMGIPVISGIADPAIRTGMVAHWGRLPFYEANTDTLLSAIRALALDADLRAEYVARGTEHVERWHDDRVTVASLQAIYAQAGPTKPGGSEKRLTAKELR